MYTSKLFSVHVLLAKARTSPGDIHAEIQDLMSELGLIEELARAAVDERLADTSSSTAAAGKNGQESFNSLTKNIHENTCIRF